VGPNKNCKRRSSEVWGGVTWPTFKFRDCLHISGMATATESICLSVCRRWRRCDVVRQHYCCVFSHCIVDDCSIGVLIQWREQLTKIGGRLRPRARRAVPRGLGAGAWGFGAYPPRKILNFNMQSCAFWCIFASTFTPDYMQLAAILTSLLFWTLC